MDDSVAVPQLDKLLRGGVPPALTDDARCAWCAEARDDTCNWKPAGSAPVRT